MLKSQGPYLIIGTIVVFMALHLMAAHELMSVKTTIATTLSGIAFLLMTFSMLLSTRLNIFEDLFGGLDRMYQVHKISGVVSMLLILLHFFLIPKALPAGTDPIVNAITPSGPLGMLALILLVVLLVIALNRKISYSKWRPTHKFMGLVYLLAIGHFLTAPAIFFNLFSASGFFLIAAAIIGTLSLIYSVFGMNKRTAIPFTIEKVNAMERATEIVLSPKNKPLDFRAGQFVIIEIAGKGWSEPHPFTVSSAPGEKNLKIAIKVLGDWTRKVREELQSGVEVKVRGPYGRFDTTKAGKKQVWLAGGIGLTPFLSSLRAMKEDDEREIHLVYAAREVGDAIFLDEIKERAAALKSVTIVSLFSDEGNFARVDRMKEKLPEPLHAYEYFMCGPKPMVSGIMGDLKKEGISKSKIHTEAFEFR